MANTNIIYPSYENPVIINVSGITDSDGNSLTLNSFTKITATFGSDSRNTTDNPSDVVVSSGTQLKLFFQGTTETTSQYWIISGTYNGDEYIISNECKNNLEKTFVCT